MIALLGSFVSFFSEFLPIVLSLARLFKEAKQKKWIESGRALAKEIKEADTDEKRKELSIRLFNTFNK